MEGGQPFWPPAPTAPQAIALSASRFRAAACLKSCMHNRKNSSSRPFLVVSAAVAELSSRVIFFSALRRSRKRSISRKYLCLASAAPPSATAMAMSSEAGSPICSAEVRAVRPLRALRAPDIADGMDMERDIGLNGLVLLNNSCAIAESGAAISLPLPLQMLPTPPPDCAELLALIGNARTGGWPPTDPPEFRLPARLLQAPACFAGASRGGGPRPVQTGPAVAARGLAVQLTHCGFDTMVRRLPELADGNGNKSVNQSAAGASETRAVSGSATEATSWFRAKARLAMAANSRRLARRSAARTRQWEASSLYDLHNLRSCTTRSVQVLIVSSIASTRSKAGSSDLMPQRVASCASVHRWRSSLTCASISSTAPGMMRTMLPVCR
mmetsp:Transcript_35723/g.102914  ORF Transcript_35723/g.102914 Transcript_35723/m.102914 type:complete len:384 (-) Transcript_35723:246-1397(-)